MADMIKNNIKDSTSGLIFRDIHILLQKFYLMRRMIRSQYEAGSLRISEAQTLFQVFIEGRISASRLTSVLQLDKSTISRMIKGLINKGFISTEQSEDDQRVQLLLLTKKGISYVKQIQQSNNRILSECLRSLSVKEQYELGNLLNLLADGLKCSEASYLPGDHPVTLATVRLGRGTGMSGPSFMNTKYSSTQYHILLLLAENPGSTFTLLSEKLPLHKSSLSRGLKELKVKNFITLEESSNDTYHSKLTLNEQGNAILKSIDREGERLIRKGLEKSSASMAARLKELLEKLMAPAHASDDSSILQKRIEIKRINSLEDRKNARGILTDSLVRNNFHFDTPDYLYHPENSSFGLYIEDQLVAACEIFPGKMKTLQNQTQLPYIEEELIKMFHKKVLDLC